MPPPTQGIAEIAMYVSDRLPRPSHVTFTLPFTLLPVVVMLVILLIGEAFRRGVELRDDVEGLTECRSRNRTASSATSTTCSRREG